MEIDYTKGSFNKDDIRSKDFEYDSGEFSEIEPSNYQYVGIFQAQIGEVTESIKLLKNEILKVKTNVIEVLGIFVALFTFISADIQIVKYSISFLSVVGFILITLGSLLFFVFILHFVLNGFVVDGKFIGEKIGAGLILIFILIGLGSFFVYKDFGKFTTEVENNFYTKSDLKEIILENERNTKILTCLEDSGWFNKKCFQK